MANRVNIPQPGVYLPMGASEEYPGGRVVHLQPGWVELDDELAKHSVLRNLIPEDDAEQERRFKLYEAEAERNKTISDAQIGFYQTSVEMQDERLEELRGLEEERAERVEEDQKKGILRIEPHPDPLAQWSIALTAGPEYHMTSSAAMASKLPDAQPPDQQKTLPPESGGGTATSLTQPPASGSGISPTGAVDVSGPTGTTTPTAAPRATL